MVVGKSGVDFAGRRYTICSSGTCVACGKKTFFLRYEDNSTDADPRGPAGLRAEVEVRGVLACWGCFEADHDKIFELAKERANGAARS